MTVVCCQVEFSMIGQSLVQRVLWHVVSKTECDLEISIMQRPTSIRVVIPQKKSLTYEEKARKFSNYIFVLKE